LAVVAGSTAAPPDAAGDLEDDSEAVVGDLEAVGVDAADLVLGVSASGRTPYTVTGLRFARRRGARTAALVCSVDSPMAAEADLSVVVPTGAEVVRGSTRLAAGTAQKLVLDQLSTLTMAALGHVSGELMIGARPDSAELRDRSLRAVAEAAGATVEQARAAVEAAGGDAKVALVSLRRNASAGDARAALDAVGGDLRAALGERAVRPAMVVSALRAGLDVGGTKTFGVLVDAEGGVVASHRAPTRRGPVGVVDSVLEVLAALAATAGIEPDAIASVGIGMPGLVDPVSGTAVLAVNLDVERLPLAAEVTTRLGGGVQVAVDNDVKAAAVGAWHELGRPSGSLGYIAIGTGLAAGLVFDGLVRHGPSGAAGEIGHLAPAPADLDAEAPLCRCGQRGCLETLASGSALRRDLAAAGAPGSSAEALFTAPQPPAVAAVRDRFADRLAFAARLLVLTADVDLVVFGGGIADAGEGLRTAVAAALERQAAGVPFLAGLHLPDRVRVVPAGSRTGAVGAALLPGRTP
jgi:predicted NBD/HSP70 family sugar kinase